MWLVGTSYGLVAGYGAVVAGYGAVVAGYGAVVAGYGAGWSATERQAGNSEWTEKW